MISPKLGMRGHQGRARTASQSAYKKAANAPEPQVLIASSVVRRRDRK